MQTIDRQCEKFMGGPLGVYLYYNRQKDMIILEKTDALSAPNAFVFKDGGYSARMLYSKPFLKHFNIRVQGTVKFLDPATDALGNLYLKLSETINVSAGKRTRKKKSDE